MHWVVFGLGAVGGYFGGRLSNAGERVTFVTRGESLRKVAKEGLFVKSIAGDFTQTPKHFDAVDSANLGLIAKNDMADVILLCCKTWQSVPCLKICEPYIQSTTVVLPLQNGVTGLAALQKELKRIKRGKLIAGLCNIVAKKTAPNHIHHFAAPAYIAFGEIDNKKTKDVLAMQKVFDKCVGMKGKLAQDIHSIIWEKFAFISTTSALCAVSGLTQDQMMEIPEVKENWIAGMQEVIACARKQGIEYKEEWLNHRIELLIAATGATTSMSRDILSGKPSELNELTGAVCKIGKKLGVPTPVHQTMYACLLPKELKTRHMAPYDEQTKIAKEKAAKAFELQKEADKKEKQWHQKQEKNAVNTEEDLHKHN